MLAFHDILNVSRRSRVRTRALLRCLSALWRPCVCHSLCTASVAVSPIIIAPYA